MNEELNEFQQLGKGFRKIYGKQYIFNTIHNGEPVSLIFDDNAEPCSVEEFQTLETLAKFNNDARVLTFGKPGDIITHIVYKDTVIASKYPGNVGVFCISPYFFHG